MFHRIARIAGAIMTYAKIKDSIAHAFPGSGLHTRPLVSVANEAARNSNFSYNRLYPGSNIMKA